MRQDLRILWIPALLFCLAGFVTGFVAPRTAEGYIVTLGIQQLWFMAGFGLWVVWLGVIRARYRPAGCALLLVLGLLSALSLVATAPK